MRKISVKSLWVLIFLSAYTLLGLRYWQLVNLNHALGDDILRSNEHTEQLIHSFAQSKREIYEHYGKKVNLDGLDIIYEPEEHEPQISMQPKILLVFSELTCNVCQDEESMFGNELVKDLGVGFVFAVIHAQDARYARNYIRLNNVQFTTFHGTHAFLEKYRFHATPLVLLLDKDNKVIFAHQPIPGYPQLSEPFHEYIRNFFALNKEDHYEKSKD